MATKDILDLSDEEFLEAVSAGIPTEEETTEQETEVSNELQGEEVKEEISEADEEEAVTESDEAHTKEIEPDTYSDTTTDESTEPSEDKDTEVTEVDYKGFYEKILTPFKANGKTVELRTPEEAIQMMQMGANYTRKMQDIAPYRKIIMMLEKNDLLDENQLSFLIDLNKKDPNAIQKLLKDSEIDPLDIDTSADVTYQEGNHRISNEEAALTQVLEEVGSTQEGAETIQLIKDTWDQASKEVLWKDPNIVSVITQQKANGIYDTINTEIERQRMLGAIPVNTSFLDAYKAVGEYLQKQGAFNNLSKPKPIRTVKTPKTPSTDSRVKAASTTKSSPVRGNNSIKDPLALSDDEFLKYMQGRV